MRVRRRPLQHAFEQAMEDAERLVPDDASPSRVAAGDAARGGGARGLHEVLERFVESDRPVHRQRSLADNYRTEAAETFPRKLAAPAREAAAARETSTSPTPERDLKTAVAEVRQTVSRGLSASELKRLRRRFAREHHPDRVPAEQRAEAVDAMATVNALIDRALAGVEGR